MNSKKVLHLFLLFWIGLNLFTAAKTELYADEAYYWMYAQFMAWGYFDHPPGLAFIIKLGSIFGKNEFAVRIVNVLLSAASIYLMHSLVKPRNTLSFVAILFVSPILHITGFVSLPDGLFLFCSLLFLYAFKRFIEAEAKQQSIILLGICAALMIYAKYHAAIVILFSVLAVPRILINYKIYLAGLFALLLLTPHLYWQYVNDFPSISYHLVDRASSSYKYNHTLDFISSNIFFLFGLSSLLLLYSLIKHRSATAWQRILKFNFLGTYLFFFLITFKGQYIEANWTITALFPLLYLGIKEAEKSNFIHKIKIVSLVFVPLMLLLRIHILFPLFDAKNDRVWDFHRAEQFVEEVIEQADGTRIVTNKYQHASLINFYADLDYWVPALNIHSRANQFSIWQLEKDTCFPEDILFLSNDIKSNVKVLDRKGSHQNLTQLSEVIFPNCLQIRESRLNSDDGILEVAIMLEGPYQNNFADEFSLQLLILREEKPLEEHYLKFSDALGQDTRLSWKVDSKSLPNDHAEIALVSNKLRGSNNQRTRCPVH